MSPTRSSRGGSDHQRRRARIVLRKYVLGQSEEEIAEEEDISLKSVKYHLEKAEEEGLIDYVKEKFVESE